MNKYLRGRHFLSFHDIIANSNIVIQLYPKNNKVLTRNERAVCFCVFV